jgi:DNA replication protein DnaC
MNITLEMLKNQVEQNNYEPSGLELSKFENSILKKVEQAGLKKTELISQCLPHIARRRIEISKGVNTGSKGVALLGSVGVGKTVALKLAAHVFDCEFLTISELAVMFSREGASAFWATVECMHCREDLILDDIGSEPDIRNFGNQLPISDLIYSRYEMWKTYGKRLWFSSNLSGKELENRYGVRVVDRIREMCNVIPCTGKSLRK